MEFHPEKWKVLQVINKRNVSEEDYSIHGDGHTLKITDIALTWSWSLADRSTSTAQPVN